MNHITGLGDETKHPALKGGEDRGCALVVKGDPADSRSLVAELPQPDWRDLQALRLLCVDHDDIRVRKRARLCQCPRLSCRSGLTPRCARWAEGPAHHETEHHPDHDADSEHEIDVFAAAVHVRLLSSA